MFHLLRVVRILGLLSCLSGSPSAQALDLSGPLPIPEDVDLSHSFSVRLLVLIERAVPADLPVLVASKDWESGETRDYTTNNAYGMGRESGSLAGFAISVLPDGAWTWNAGDGRARIDHRPEALDQDIADGRWHEVGFAVDRAAGVVHLYYDGLRVALHDLQGLGSLAPPTSPITPPANLRKGGFEGLRLSDLRIEPGAATPAQVAREFAQRFDEDRAPAKREVWDGQPLKVLAWNIWHGGRRKGPDEGVQRVYEVIRDSGADLVLMQETYGSGPRIAGRLGYEFYLRSSNLSILSRFPITEVHRLYQGFRFGGATIELRPGLEMEAYSLWIHYLPDVGAALESGATVEDLIAEEAKTRGKEVQDILEALGAHQDTRVPVPTLIGGDFNSASHLDWTLAAASMPSHRGLSVPWPVSLAMARARFFDTYRTAHPDPSASPGMTWSPEYQDSHPERIDYVYASEGDWRVLDSRVLSEHPRGWPSDHAAVLTTLQLTEPQPALKVMSYNIHYGVGMDEKVDLARIAAIITAESPDLVGLQEIGSRAMADELSRLTGMPAMFGPSKGSDNAYGDAILCRHPSLWIGNVSLPSASSSRYQAMAVDVDVSAIYGSGPPVRFINTHFDWTDSIGSQESRRAAVEVIERAFFTGAPGLALLAGDLNAVPGSDPLNALHRAHWHLPGLGQPMVTCCAPDPTQQIDYVLVRPREAWRVLDVRVLDEPIASDHRPVVIRARPLR